MTVTVGKYRYQILDGSHAAFIGLKRQKTGKVKIPKTIRTAGNTYQVTQIAAKALKNQKKITAVDIDGQITIIGENAFAGCKKLRTITIRSEKLKKVGKNACKGIYAKAKIKVPKKKLSAYKKLFKGKGQGKNVTIIKK